MNFFVLLMLAPSFVFAKVTFDQKKLRIGNKVLTVEVADSFEQQARGLMFRTSLNEGAGMMFVYDREKVLSFWMKNTLIPLSIGFFTKDQALMEVLDMEVPSSMLLTPPSYKSKDRVMYALEVPLGWFAKNKISPKTQPKFSWIKVQGKK